MNKLRKNVDKLMIFFTKLIPKVQPKKCNIQNFYNTMPSIYNVEGVLIISNKE